MDKEIIMKKVFIILGLLVSVLVFVGCVDGFSNGFEWLDLLVDFIIFVKVEIVNISDICVVVEINVMDFSFNDKDNL